MQNWRDILADYLRRLLAQPDVSIYKVSKKAKQFGYKLSPTTVWDVANAKNKDVGIETLFALAKGFGIPARELFTKIIDLSVEEIESTEDARVIAYLRELPSDVKADTIAILETIWRLHEVGKRKPMTNEMEFLESALSQALNDYDKAKDRDKKKLAGELIEKLRTLLDTRKTA